MVALQVSLPPDGHHADEGCMRLRGDTEPGVTVWERFYAKSGVGVVTAPVEDGTRLCTLGRIGSCKDSKRSWAHYILGRDGIRRRAPDDPTAYSIQAGELDAWMWGSPEELPLSIGTSFEEVCEGGPFA